MKPKKRSLFGLTLIIAVIFGVHPFVADTVAQSLGQNSGGYYRPLTLAPADAPSSGGGGVGAATNSAAEIAKKLQNPVASMISVPIQNNWDFGIGEANAMSYTAVIEPVIPIHLSENWNLISRTIVPVIYAESPVKGGQDHSGLGDIVEQTFFTPVKPVGGWILGLGPLLSLPTATDSTLGSGQWGAGPSALVLKQEKGFTYGGLVTHTWSFAGWGDDYVSATFMEPFVSFTTKRHTTFTLNTETTYNWNDNPAGQWTVPLNLEVAQLVKIGKTPVQFQIGGRYYAEKPDGGPDWGLRFTMTLVFPE